jgi:hypothetical protein
MLRLAREAWASLKRTSLQAALTAARSPRHSSARSAVRSAAHGATMLAALLSVAAPTSHAADLTPTETRWLQGAWPVVTYAEQAGMPLDIVVQPQTTPGAAPLAMAFIGGRCKLVLSMRGNPEAAATLERIAPALLDAALELMAAHELGHCRRHLDGNWHGLPAGFVAPRPDSVSPELQGAFVRMKATRREEAYADLVGLAWIQATRPKDYQRMHAWLSAERARDLLPGSHHDTLAWLSLAREGVGPGGGTMFSRALPLWTAGLAAEQEH